MTDLAQQWRERLDGDAALELTSLDDLPGLAGAFRLHEQIEASLEPESGLYVEDAKGVVSQVSLTWTIDDKAIGTASVDFNTAAGFASLEGMRLAPGLQGNGLGRQFVRQLVDLSVGLGLDEVRTFASQVGRYAWAQCGFDFAEADERAGAIAAAVAVAKRLGRELDGTGIEHSWKLAQLDGDPIPRSVAVELFGDDLSHNGIEKVPYGKALLLGTTRNWAGCLTLAEQCPCRAQLAAR